MKRNRRSNREQVVSNFLVCLLCQNSSLRRRQQKLIEWEKKEENDDDDVDNDDGDGQCVSTRETSSRKWKTPSPTKSSIKFVSNLVNAKCEEEKKCIVGRSRVHTAQNELSAADQEYIKVSAVGTYERRPMRSVRCDRKMRKQKLNSFFFFHFEQRTLIEWVCCAEPWVLPSCSTASQHTCKQKSQH